MKSAPARIPDDQLLNIHGVCHLLADCSPKTIKRLELEGKLHPLVFGGRTSYRRSEVNAFIASLVEGRAPWRNRPKAQRPQKDLAQAAEKA